MSIIDEYLKWKEQDRRIQPPNILYVTQLTKPCLQQAWLGIHHDREHAIETLRIFDAGNVLEDHWVDILRSSPHTTTSNSTEKSGRSTDASTPSASTTETD